MISDVPHISLPPLISRRMSLPNKQPWSSVKLEVLTPMLSRRVLTAEKAMIAQVYLKKGAIVKAHEHHNEQITYILEGGLRFWLGENADKAPNAEYLDLMAGEVFCVRRLVRVFAEPEAQPAL